MVYKLIFIRKGRKRDPIYNICVKCTRSFKLLDTIGFYKPLSKTNNKVFKFKEFSLNLKKYNFWLFKGLKIEHFLLKYNVFTLLRLKKH